ncbi:hypothetical protein [Clostridium thermarum]|uniref:hypothetical protein n=1 Tax=Clostridium thermarum TaxID=1716543 RepID=UPI0013D0D69F|nr:hypothetical protein [Clostridium thermarum]
MDLASIKKVEDLTIMGDVNRRLEEGWVLIDTYVNNYDPNSYPGVNTLHYVLGLPAGLSSTEIPQDTNYEPDMEL